MSSELHLVVGGLPGFVPALTASGRFANVYPISSTSELRALTAGELRGLAKKDVVFVFSDHLVDDVPQMSFDRLLAALVGGGWKVMVVATSMRGRDLVAAHPGTGLLEPPFTVNLILGALSGLPGVTTIAPVADGGVTLDPVTGPDTTPAPAAAPAAPAPAAAPAAAPAPAPAWTPITPTVDEPDDTPAPAAPAAAPAPAPAAWAPQAPPAAWADTPAPAPVAPAPAPAAPATDAWGRPAADPAGGGLRPPTSMRAPAAPAADDAWGANPFAGAGRGPVARRGALHTEPAQSDRRGFVISVTAPKGGVGKSSLSLNLAVALGLRLKAQGKRVAIVDMNIQQADVGKYLNEYRVTVTKLARDATLISRDRITQAMVHVEAFNVWALLGPNDTAEANPEFLRPELYGRILTVLRQLFDYVILDLPVAERYHDLVSFALDTSDFVLVPVIPSPQTVHNVNRWLTEAVVAPASVGGAGLDRNKIGIVLNRAEDDIGFDEDAVRAELASWRYLGSVPETKEWKRANAAYQVVAAMGLPDLNAAFAHILYQATATLDPQGRPTFLEQALAPGARVTQEKTSLIKRLLKRGS